MKIIGLDVGEKRIGVAKADSSTRIAVPVGYLLNDASLWQELSRLARLNSTNVFVLGLPRSNEGNETKQSLYVRNFAKTLVEKIPDARIKFQDESLTSVEAEDRLKKRKKGYEKGDIDAESAAIILQDFVESFRGTAGDLTAEAKIQRASLDTPKKESASAAKKDSPKNQIKKAADAAKTSRPAQKIVLESKKAQSKIKKIAIFGIPLSVILILVGITAVLKIRDKIRADREEEYRRQEAAMVAEVFDFTITPGETIFDVRKKLLKVGYEATEVEEALTFDYDFDFLEEPRAKAASGAIQKSQYLEGYLLGETHEFYATDTAKDVIKKFLEGSAKVFTEYGLAEKYANKGLSLYQGVTLASVVQKEAPTSEMPTVAQVFLTRLDYGWRLGSDVTVTYALDTIDPDRRIYSDNHSALDVDSCYNTRKFTGLPCGPIANPGLSALLAVAEPSDTSYLYFLTGDDGMMYYSYTESEHNYNIGVHCKELCAVQL